MVHRPLCISTLLLIGGAAAIGGSTSASALAEPSPGHGANFESALGTVSTAAVRGAAPVYQDTDSLAFRALVAQPTEYIDSQLVGQAKPGDLVGVKLLGFNDFHGHLSATRVLEGRPLGGAAVLASYLRTYTQGYAGRSVIAHAGDLVGASSAESSLFQDEPTIAFFNQLSNGQCDRKGVNPKCNLVGILGNHEFDEGVDELMRLVRGGNHSKGPFLASAYRGARYPTVCANVIYAGSGQPILPPYVIKELAGVRVGFVGAVYAGAPWFLKKSGLASVRFIDEAASVNERVRELKAQGVHAVVVIIHQGGKQRFSQDLPRDASALSGEVVETVSKLDAAVDVVLSGHSHSALSALVPNSGGRPTLLTQAFHSSTAFSEIDLDIDSSVGVVVKKRVRIVSTFADEGPGTRPDEPTLRIVRAAERVALKKTSLRVGRASTAISAGANIHGESTMGDIVADAQRAALHADFAFTTPAWVPSGLDPGPVTWGALFGVQPFGNRLFWVELRGRQVVELLNQQWATESYSRILHVSGLTYTWDGTRPANDRVVEVMVLGQPLDLYKRYLAAVNEFLAEGGEGFSVFENARRTPSALLDIDALAMAFKSRPVFGASIDGRIRRIDSQAPSK